MCQVSFLLWWKIRYLAPPKIVFVHWFSIFDNIGILIFFWLNHRQHRDHPHHHAHQGHHDHHDHHDQWSSLSPGSARDLCSDDAWLQAGTFLHVRRLVRPGQQELAEGEVRSFWWEGVNLWWHCGCGCDVVVVVIVTWRAGTDRGRGEVQALKSMMNHHFDGRLTEIM